jgi:hypothetical protein
MTGRAAGYCAGNDMGGFMTGGRRGFGGGAGWGRGGGGGGGRGRFRQRWWPRGLRGGAETDAPADESKVAGLRRMVERLQDAVSELEDQIRGAARPKASRATDTTQEKP